MIKLDRTGDRRVDMALRALVRQIEKEFGNLSGSISVSAASSGGGGSTTTTQSLGRIFLTMGA